jgi:hypothetical protein
MKLINDIINELIDTDKTITSPLLKTKVLASRLQNESLLNWVSNELKGYDLINSLPDYRKFTCNIKGTYISGNMQYNDQPVPTVGIDKELEGLIRIMNLTSSVASLEKLQKERKNGVLEHTFPAELIGLIQGNWRKMGNPYLQLVNCKKVLSINAVDEVLSNVRNSLLDFMLKIDHEFGNLTEIEELKTKQKEISTIMNQTIINNTGDGNIVNTGENAEIKATISINKGDLTELMKQLKNIGIEKSDAEQLIEIINLEEPNLKNKTFGLKVNEWIQKMLGKTLDGTWNIGIGAAGNLLTDALKMYYGM